MGPDGTMKLLKVPFNNNDLEIRKRNVKDYRKDPISIAGHFQLTLKQHNPNWSDIQLLLHAMTETEKQLFLKLSRDLARSTIRKGGCKGILPFLGSKLGCEEIGRKREVTRTP